MATTQQGAEHEAQRTEEVAQNQLRHHLGQLRATVRQHVEKCRQNRRGSVRLYAPYLIQLSPDDETNINFWGHPTEEMPECETGMHNHYVSFTSDIIYGRLLNFKYAVTDDPEGPFKRFCVKRWRDADNQWQYAIEPGTERAQITTISEDEWVAGDNYGLGAAEYHSNSILVPTITMMHIDRSTEGNPEVFFVPVEDRDYTTTLTMRTPKTEDQLDEAWARIDAFLALMEGEC